MDAHPSAKMEQTPEEKNCRLACGALDEFAKHSPLYTLTVEIIAESEKEKYIELKPCDFSRARQRQQQDVQRSVLPPLLLLLEKS